MIKNNARQTLQELVPLLEKAEDKWNELSSSAQNELNDAFSNDISLSLNEVMSAMGELLGEDMEMKMRLCDADDINDDPDHARAKEQDLISALAQEPMDLEEVALYLSEGYGIDLAQEYALALNHQPLARLIAETYPLHVSDGVQLLAEEGPAACETIKLSA